MHAEAEGTEGVDARRRAVGAVSVLIAQGDDPALRQLRQPPQDVLAALQLLTRLVKAFLTQKLCGMAPEKPGSAVCLAKMDSLAASSPWTEENGCVSAAEGRADEALAVCRCCMLRSSGTRKGWGLQLGWVSMRLTLTSSSLCRSSRALGAAVLITDEFMPAVCNANDGRQAAQLLARSGATSTQTARQYSLVLGGWPGVIASARTGLHPPSAKSLIRLELC